MILALYRGLTTLAGPLIALILRYRVHRGKEDPQRLGERRGIAGRPRPAGRLVWLHAASLGEAVSMLPVVERLRSDAGVAVLMTTGTVTSAALMLRRLPEGAIHQFVPFDRLAWVRRFLDHWRPDLALWVESELWPNLVVEATTRHIPMILLNGRMSERSFARWRRLPSLIRRLLAGFVLCLGQTPADAARFGDLGAVNVAFAGNLKFAAPPLPADAARLAALTLGLQDRPCWLAASTHDGEEGVAGTIHARLAPDHPGLLTVIVPRHPPRGAAISAELADLNLRVARRSQGEAVSQETDILLGDTVGELGEFFRLVRIVFVGKSLIGRGGQNPLEPARLGAAVLFGPNMDNFHDIASRMSAGGAALQVADADALAAAIDTRLRTPSLVAAEGERARAFAASEAGVLERVLAELSPWLPRTEVVCARS